MIGVNGMVCMVWEDITSHLKVIETIKCKLFNSLDDLKVAHYVCPNHTNDDIYSDHSYLDTLGIPLNSTLIP